MGNSSSKATKTALDILVPPLGVEDAIIDEQKKKFEKIQSEMTSMATDFASLIKETGTLVTDLQKREMQSMYFSSVISSFDQIGDVSIDSSTLKSFNTKPYEIAQTAVTITANVATIVAMCIPGGDIAALVIPIVGYVINDAIEISELDKAIKVAKENKDSLQSQIDENTPKLLVAQESVVQYNAELDEFDNQAFSLLGVTSWDEVKNLNDVSIRFQEDIDDMENITSLDEAQSTAALISDDTERKLYLEIYEEMSSTKDNLNDVSLSATSSRSFNLVPTSSSSKKKRTYFSRTPEEHHEKANQLISILISTKKVAEVHLANLLHRQMIILYAIGGARAVLKNYEQNDAVNELNSFYESHKKLVGYAQTQYNHLKDLFDFSSNDGQVPGYFSSKIRNGGHSLEKLESEGQCWYDRMEHKLSTMIGAISDASKRHDTLITKILRFAFINRERWSRLEVKDSKASALDGHMKKLSGVENESEIRTMISDIGIDESIETEFISLFSRKKEILTQLK